MSLHHNATFADQAWHGPVEIEENVQLAHGTWRVRFAAPEIAARILPGQFLMLRIAGSDDPLLGRPLAYYNTVLDSAGQPVGLDVVYLVVGKATSRLAELRRGARLEVWGPLGNGFPAVETSHLVMVAGGIGQTPFLALASEALGVRQYGQPARSVPRAQRVTLCYGARNANLLAGVDDFQAVGVDVRVSTDDGSAGHHGLVTELLEQLLSSERESDLRVVCCGPEKMMEAVAQLTSRYEVPCQVSLETPMACGLGICFSCVARVRTADGSWDYRRTCVEGPVFDAEAILF